MTDSYPKQPDVTDLSGGHLRPQDARLDLPIVSLPAVFRVELVQNVDVAKVCDDRAGIHQLVVTIIGFLRFGHDVYAF